MNSTRLPGKSLRLVGSHPLIWWVVTRTLATQGLDDVICATTTKPEDDELVNYVGRQFGIRCYRGSEEDVLNRMLVAGDTCDADVMVRVTADDPFKDPVVMGLAVSTFLREPGIDLCQNVDPRTCPVGVDIEVLSMSALRRVERLASTPVDREHVTSFFYSHANDFLIVGIGDTANPYIDVRLTIDTQQDLDFVSLLATRHEDNPLVNYEVLAQEAASRASASFNAS